MIDSGAIASGEKAGKSPAALVATVGADGPATLALVEMLEHQGISCRRGSTGMKEHFPFVVLADQDRANRDVASSICGAGGAVVDAAEIVEFERVGQLLSGEHDNREDSFGAFVNEQEEKLVGELGKRAEEQGLQLFQKWFWPDFAPAACILTHDLDWLEYSPAHRVAMRTPGGVLRQPGLLFRKWFRGAKYGWNIPEMVSAEAAAGFHSTFFLKTKYEQSEQQALSQTMKQLRASRSEVALHASRASYRKEESLRGEIEEMTSLAGRPPAGVRQHILKFQVPATWKIQSSAGLKFDATFSYNEYFGFRSGSCFPYHPIVAGERLPIIELPTSFMDWTFLHRGYGKRDAEAALWRVADTVERHHGLLVVNFHNTYLDRAVFPDVWDLYGELLARLRTRGYWVATASEATAWWLRRGTAPPIPDPSAEAGGPDTPVRYLAHEGGRVYKV